MNFNDFGRRVYFRDYEGEPHCVIAAFVVDITYGGETWQDGQKRKLTTLHVIGRLRIIVVGTPDEWERCIDQGADVPEGGAA